MRIERFTSSSLKIFLKEKVVATMAELKEALGTTVSKTVVRKCVFASCSLLDLRSNQEVCRYFAVMKRCYSTGRDDTLYNWLYVS